MADVFALVAGEYEERDSYAVCADMPTASAVALRWNAQRPDGKPRFEVEALPLVDVESAGDSPFVRES